MAHTMKMITVIGICLVMFLLPACGPSAPDSTPTPDLDLFRTVVAATVLAKVTLDLALTPSATPVPSPTATQVPTETAASTPEQADTAPPNPQATLTNGTPGTVDRAEWVSQSIPDGTIFAPGETFTITWTLRNVGSSTWTPFYMLRFFSGNAFGAPQEVFLDREVLPGETVDIAIPMRAPTALGEYRSDWVLANPARSNFKEAVYLEITVARPATSTPTVTVTPTMTVTSTETASP